MEGQEQWDRPGTAPCVLPSCPGLPGIQAGASLGPASEAGPSSGPSLAAAEFSCSPQILGSELWIEPWNPPLGIAGQAAPVQFPAQMIPLECWELGSAAL